MKTFLQGLFAFVLVLSMLPVTIARAGSSSVQYGIVNVSALNVRGGPGVDHSVVGYALEGEELPIFESGHMSYGYNWMRITRDGWVYGRYVDLIEMVDYDIPVGLTTKGYWNGLRAYEAWQMLENIDDAWWGDTLEAHEAGAMMLFGEIGIIAYVSDGEWKLPGIVIDAATRKWNTYCEAGAWSDRCFNGFWAYYSFWMSAEYYLDRLIEPYDLYEYQDGVFMGAGRDLVGREEIGVQSWGAASEWVTLTKSRNPVTFERLKGGAPGVYRMLYSNNLMIVLSPAQQYSYCGGEMCNMTGLP